MTHKIVTCGAEHYEYGRTWKCMKLPSHIGDRNPKEREHYAWGHVKGELVAVAWYD